MKVVIGVFLLGLLHLTCGARNWNVFYNCLPKSVPVYRKGQPMHKKITSYSFNNALYTPQFIISARSAKDVAKTVRCASKAELRVCARSGGHSFTGASLCPGVMIDLKSLSSVSVNPRTKEATIGPGAVMGEMFFKIHKYRRWIGGSASPAVGLAGYLLGGGRGVFEGKIGIACDYFTQITIVTRRGRIIRASRKRHAELFWAMCGAGGGQFGIVTEIKIRTVSSRPIDNSVFFRYEWPRGRAGTLITKWLNFKEDNGNIRGTIGLGLGDTKITVEGLCFDSPAVAECEGRLKKEAFFNVPERNATFVFKPNDALDMHATQGPAGDWGRKRVVNVRDGLIGQRNVEAGGGNERTHHSPYMRNPPRSVKFWQRWAEYCTNPRISTLPWINCELFLVQNANAKKMNNAFPHRGQKLLLHYILGGGPKADRARAYKWMSDTFRPYITGVYGNYPELELKKRYAKMYWGKNLCRLRRLKSKYDPDVFFFNSQPVPPLSWNGYGSCPTMRKWTLRTIAHLFTNQAKKLA